MIGPLYLPIATYVSLLNNICTAWYLLTLTQMTLVKVLMIFKWSFMTGIDDNFVGQFLIIVNVGFLSLSQLARHWLGSMYESQEFHMLSGKMCVYDNNVVQLVFTQFTSCARVVIVLIVYTKYRKQITKSLKCSRFFIKIVRSC